MKKMTIVWTITLLVIITGLTIYGFKMKENDIGDISEESLVTQVKKYLGTYPALYPTKGNEIRFSSDRLKEEGYDPELDENCVGYVVVKNENMGFSYEPYVKCENYVTKGYSNE